MSTSLLNHAQGIVGFQHKSYKYEEKSIIEQIYRKRFLCPKCFYEEVSIFPFRKRHIQCDNFGNKRFYIQIDIHRVYCPKCKAVNVEKLPFLSYEKSRITKQLQRTIVQLRSEMSISAIAKYYNLNWRTVKNCEKRHLKKKYSKIKLKDVKIIGIDEIYVSRVKNKEKYLTIVRDLETGSVLYVGKGKGIESLKQFSKKLRHCKAKIGHIAMDMSKSYISWAKKNLPNATIVFDHFHMIKLMNDKVDKVRRRTMENIDDQHKSLLKNSRFLWLRNVENLEGDAKLLLDNLRKTFKDLGEINMMKEALRSIYKIANEPFEAQAAFKNWISIANQTNLKELHTMAKTIKNHMEGICAYFQPTKITNASMEGFNNKIRWLIRQAYGFRDDEYFTLKIYNLPDMKIVPPL